MTDDEQIPVLARVPPEVRPAIEATALPAEDLSPGAAAVGRRGIRLGEGHSLRQHAARGTVINGMFSTGLTLLTFLKGFLIAIFLSPSEFGVWGVLVISLGTLTWLKQVGICDLYIQQEEEDQELAFQRAFSMELLVNAALFGLLALAVPGMALLYGRSELLLPGFALIMLIPAGQMQVAFWVLYRRMEFARQRRLQAIDPVVGFVVTVALAASGAGYWALVLGALAGSYAAGAVALRTSPYPLKFVYDRGTLRRYATFSGPLFFASLGGLVTAQGTILFGEDAAGLIGAGAITLAASISQLSQRVDDTISGTLYPVICAVRESRDLLFETFVKSNRLALMWAMPFGAGLALFADDLVHFVLGDKWTPAIIVLQASGIVAALNHLGFNWPSYARALDNTRAIMVHSVAVTLSFFAVNVPLLYAFGLKGAAAGLLATFLTSIAVRTVVLGRMFPGFGLTRHAIRPLAVHAPAVLIIGALRVADAGGDRSASLAAAELALFLVVTAASTLALERELLKETLGYLRRRAVGAT